MYDDIFNLKIVGEEREKVILTGILFAKIFVAGGYNVFDYADISLLGNKSNSYSVNISQKKVRSPRVNVDMLVALDSKDISEYEDGLKSGSIIVYNSNKLDLSEKSQYLKEKHILLFPTPVCDLLKQEGAESIIINIAVLGASLAIVDYDIKIVDYILEKNFAHKSFEEIQSYKDVIKSAYDYVKKNFKDGYKKKFPVISDAKQLFLNGNEATALGAIKGGCKLFCYPLAPASSILDVIVKYQEDFKLVINQAEDALSAAYTSLGGAYTGVRSLAITSGKDLSSIGEVIGLSSETETPLVVFVEQQAGPGIGLTTKTEQSCLQAALHTSQGEYPKIAIAPGDIEEFFNETIRAFNLAEKYQLPVILLSDKFISESHQSISNLNTEKISVYRDNAILDEEYERYRLMQNGISTRSIPSMVGRQFIANSHEHDKDGYSSESKEIRVAMMDKRAAKSVTMLVDIPKPTIFSNIDSTETDLSLISWGSNKGVILDVMDLLSKEGISANFMHIVYVEPFLSDEVEKFIKKSKLNILVENNRSGELGKLIKEHTGLNLNHKILKYDGTPFFTEDVFNLVMKIYKRWQR